MLESSRRELGDTDASTRTSYAVTHLMGPRGARHSQHPWPFSLGKWPEFQEGLDTGAYL